MLEALKVAKQQRIISSTLDPLYVQMRAVQVYKALSASPNRTIIMLPTTPEGTGLPQVLTEGKRKVLTKADEQLLEDMETRYMKVAGQPVPDTNGSARRDAGGSNAGGSDAGGSDDSASDDSASDGSASEGSASGALIARHESLLGSCVRRSAERQLFDDGMSIGRGRRSTLRCAAAIERASRVLEADQASQLTGMWSS